MTTANLLDQALIRATEAKRSGTPEDWLASVGLDDIEYFRFVDSANIPLHLRGIFSTGFQLGYLVSEAQKGES